MTETEQDANNRRWFNTGWDACRREVLAMAEHVDDTAAVDWASRHPARYVEVPKAAAPDSEPYGYVNGQNVL